MSVCRHAPGRGAALRCQQDEHNWLASHSSSLSNSSSSSVLSLASLCSVPPRSKALLSILSFLSLALACPAAASTVDPGLLRAR